MTISTQPTHVPTYIERRIRRRVPVDSQIVPGSTPVVAFGRFRTAQVATLGLNPSKVEFLDRAGNELREDDRRLATHASLGTADLSNAQSDLVAQVLDDCEEYFDRNPYRRWFNQLEGVLAQCGVSYYDGTACHLDLVQWATDPTWGGLSNEVKLKLLKSDVPFLLEQLATENVRLLLVNGSGVINQLQENATAELSEMNPISGLGRNKTKLFVGSISGNIKVVGWSTNIQSSFGVTRELRTEIARRVSSLAC